MSSSPVRIPAHIHERMKDRARKNQRKIVEEYEHGLSLYLSNEAQEEILAESKLEEYINKKMKKTEDRLAGMIGRTGMDTSILVMAMMQLLSDELGEDRNKVYNEFLKQAKQYYSSTLNG